MLLKPTCRAIHKAIVDLANFKDVPNASDDVHE